MPDLLAQVSIEGWRSRSSRQLLLLGPCDMGTQFWVCQVEQLSLSHAIRFMIDVPSLADLIKRWDDLSLNGTDILATECLAVAALHLAVCRPVGRILVAGLGVPPTTDFPYTIQPGGCVRHSFPEFVWESPLNCRELAWMSSGTTGQTVSSNSILERSAPKASLLDVAEVDCLLAPESSSVFGHAVYSFFCRS